MRAVSAAIAWVQLLSTQGGDFGPNRGNDVRMIVVDIVGLLWILCDIEERIDSFLASLSRCSTHRIKRLLCHIEQKLPIAHAVCSFSFVASVVWTSTASVRIDVDQEFRAR